VKDFLGIFMQKSVENYDKIHFIKKSGPALKGWAGALQNINYFTLYT
jgi:hypothetical protein